MIDEKINNSLKGLEQGLRGVESASKQVEKVVRSYETLNTSLDSYVTNLGTVSANIQQLVTTIDNDYKNTKEAFEKDRDAIIKASRDSIANLSKETDTFKESLNGIQTKLKFSLIVNAVLLIAVGVMMFLLLK